MINVLSPMSLLRWLWEGVPAAPRKKRAHRNLEPIGSESENTIPITPLHHAAPKPADETVTSVLKNTTGGAAAGPSTENIDKEVVDLSEDTRVPSPSITVVQPSPHAGHGDTQEHTVFFDAHSIHSIHHEDDSESTVEHRFVLEWGLRDDLHVYSFRAYKELITHFASHV
ncbi:hypothetical protein Tco_1438886 [Tanacetum coccineum]